jgi:hypothetical protein
MRNPGTPKPPRDMIPSSAPHSGFEAKINGATLADLVQMECLAGSRLVVRVTSGDNVGYLYFRGGALVHAVTPVLTGESAALEMLAWNGGTVEPAEREWPVRDSISLGWQTILLRAGQAEDERSSVSIVAVRGDRHDRRAMASTDVDCLAETIEFKTTPLLVAGCTLRKEDFQLFLRMKRDGTVVASQGTSPSFADVAAYALRLSQLVGDDLGLDRFVALECTFKQGRCFIVLDEEGDVVALEPRPSTDSNVLRELFGL